MPVKEKTVKKTNSKRKELPLRKMVLEDPRVKEVVKKPWEQRECRCVISKEEKK